MSRNGTRGPNCPVLPSAGPNEAPETRLLSGGEFPWGSGGVQLAKAEACELVFLRVPFWFRFWLLELRVWFLLAEELLVNEYLHIFVVQIPIVQDYVRLVFCILE